MHNSIKGKPDNEVTYQRESKKLALILFSIISIILGIAIMFGGFWIASDPQTRDPDIEKWQDALLLDVMLAIGTSIIASVVFYWLYSITAENKVIREISSSVSVATMDYAKTLYENRFERLLPAKIYPETNVPLIEFNEDLSANLTNSNSYLFKGDSGEFTCFRLTNLCEGGRSVGKEIKLIIADPRESEIVHSRAQVELMRKSLMSQALSRTELLSMTEKLREKVFLTLVALYDISHLLKVEVALHKEFPFYRAEIFDDGIFLTYYLRSFLKPTFPSTYYFGHSSFTYEAYLLNFRMSFDAAEYHITYDSKMTEEKLQTILKDLGCETSVEDFRQMKETLFSKFREAIKGIA
jgi:hypothetical protein